MLYCLFFYVGISSYKFICPTAARIPNKERSNNSSVKDEDETMFDGRERYTKRVPRRKDNPAGFIVRSTPGGGGGWIKQVSNSENRNGMHYFSSVKDEDETMFDKRER
jgi:hypothetical protein